MSGTNHILPFAEQAVIGQKGGVMPQEEYAAHTQRMYGQQGVALSQINNKALKQSAFVASAIGRLIANNTEHDVDDTMDSDVMDKNLAEAIKASIGSVGKNMWAKNKNIAVGDIAYTSDNNGPTWAYLICTISGTTGAKEPTIPPNPTIGQTIADGGVTWKVKNIENYVQEVAEKDGEVVVTKGDGTTSKFKAGAAIPVGHISMQIHGQIAFGYLPLTGATYSRVTYPDLWAWVQKQDNLLKTDSQWQALKTSNKSVVPFYSSGDGSTTFRVPLLAGWVKGASNVNEAGNFLEAGLPNIEGQTGSPFWQQVGASGAFAPTSASVSLQSLGTATPFSKTVFSAQSYNPIYGKSNEVQPSSFVGIYCVKAYGSVEATGNTSLDSLAVAVQRVETALGEIVIPESEIAKMSLTPNGYIQFRNGLLLQWGYADATGSATNVNFPKPFSYLCSVVATARTNSLLRGSENNFATREYSNTSFTATMHDTSNYIGFSWYAVGSGVQ